LKDVTNLNAKAIQQMDLAQRIILLNKLGAYMRSDEAEWTRKKQEAAQKNPWFLPQFIETAVFNIATHFLQENLLQEWINQYQFPATQPIPQKVGIIMAGNIPLVGFHDFLCVFISGHHAIVKPSSKDEVLITHLLQKLIAWAPALADYISIAQQINGCNAYITTGSNNSSRYFEHYFGKYPNIIRRNRTSVAILTGRETNAELAALASDIQLYFGLGCRNVTKLYVPKNYDFIPLLQALKQYDYYMDFHKYKHNYDYQLAVLIMSNQYYMTNESVLLVEKESLFSPIAQIHYSYYQNIAELQQNLLQQEDVQCIIGQNNLPFGKAQQPALTDYADGVDTLLFLKNVHQRNPTA
jgi:hypothetical protein